MRQCEGVGWSSSMIQARNNPFKSYNVMAYYSHDWLFFRTKFYRFMPSASYFSVFECSSFSVCTTNARFRTLSNSSSRCMSAFAISYPNVLIHMLNYWSVWDIVGTCCVLSLILLFISGYISFFLRACGSSWWIILLGSNKSKNEAGIFSMNKAGFISVLKYIRNRSFAIL